MDQIKIGKFIAEQRKVKGLTQACLAERLGITDRAVSKWERGRGVPDVSIMLELCRELDISVNELLNGEKIDLEEYSKKAEQQLLEMAKKEERQNKRLIISMYLILITDILFYIAVLLPAAIILGESLKFSIVAAVATVIFLAIGFIALKIEVDTGYYECKIVTVRSFRHTVRFLWQCTSEQRDTCAVPSAVREAGAVRSLQSKKVKGYSL